MNILKYHLQSSPITLLKQRKKIQNSSSTCIQQTDMNKTHVPEIKVYDDIATKMTAFQLFSSWHDWQHWDP